MTVSSFSPETPSKETLPHQGNISEIAEKKQLNDTSYVDPLLLAYLYIFQTVQTTHQNAQIQAKTIQSYATAQQRIIAREAGLNFATVPHDRLFKNKCYLNITFNGRQIVHITFYASDKKDFYNAVKKGIAEGIIDPKDFRTSWKPKKVDDDLRVYLNNLQTQNQQISALRGVMADQMVLLQQGSQIAMTNLNSAADDVQQSVQQGSSLMQMLSSLTNQISKI